MDGLGIGEAGNPPVTVIRIRTERKHIVMTGDDGRLVAFVDLGPHLHFWSGQGCEIRPDLARELAARLVEWADSKDG